VPRSPPRTDDPAVAPHHVRVLATVDDTTVETDPVQDGTPVVLDAGELIELTIDSDVVVTSDQPVLVGQWYEGWGATGLPFGTPNGDPSFVLPPPTEQYRTEYVFLTPAALDLDYALIVAPGGAVIEIDSLSIDESGCEEHLAGDWSVFRCEIDDGVHLVTADVPVGLVAYGIDEQVSYGYVGGLDLEAINEE
jgi:hypothetical protein